VVTRYDSLSDFSFRYNSTVCSKILESERRFIIVGILFSTDDSRIMRTVKEFKNRIKIGWIGKSDLPLPQTQNRTGDRIMLSYFNKR
jgi:hypothetical protein